MNGPNDTPDWNAARARIILNPTVTMPPLTMPRNLPTVARPPFASVAFKPTVTWEPLTATTRPIMSRPLRGWVSDGVALAVLMRRSIPDEVFGGARRGLPGMGGSK